MEDNATGSLRHQRPLVILTVIAVLFYWISLYLYAPTLPTYVQSRVNDLSMVGLIVSMYGLWQAIIRLPLGILADWMGRLKPLILVGLALGAVGAWLMGISESATGLLIGRAITGLAAGTWVPLVVIFSNIFPPQEAVRASALLTFVGGLGRIAATAVTGRLNAWGGYSLAFYLATLAGVLAVCAMLPARERVQPPKAPSLGHLARLLSRRDVLMPSLLSMVQQYANWAATFTFVPILAKQLNANDDMLSLLMSLNIAVVTAGNLAATTLIRIIGTRRLVRLSVLLLGLGIVGVAFAYTLPLIFATQVVIGLSVGIAYPVLMGLSIRDVDNSQRSTAMGFHQSIYAIGMFVGPALSGKIADLWGIRPMLLMTGVVCTAILLWGTYYLGGERSPSSQGRSG